MKRKLVDSIVAFSALFLLGSCSKDVLVGDGPIETESRTLASFASIDIAGNRTIEIIKSDLYKVEITGYQNLVNAFESNVKDNGLSFGFPNHTRVKNDNISIKVFTPNLSAIHFSGNIQANIGGGFNLQTFEATLSGNGKIYFNEGSVKELSIRNSGNGEIYAEKLIAEEARVEISGNGLAYVHALNTLDIRISGNGEVQYWGNAKVATSISGNGKAVPH